MEVFGKLPEWVQDIIRKSTQFADNAPEEKVDIPPEDRKCRLTAKERARFDVYITGEQLSRQRLRCVGR